ncbi:MAG TPA: tRNA (adenosine(37)-N6)-threonylcarbamoyltransferase complex ATPase subunit type 1 TsaE [Xanthomonadales bacterium]|nr:tRNA (adenosine(37)-N6)-threonylcarbamoyltransferase complex ATPase subunit type 1 TsaE [Xanthomonadales bacterium]
MSQVFITKNFSQTQTLGKKFAGNLKSGAILALYGDLGSGKTTFVQGLAKGLGIKHKIISPTFIIVRKYEIPKSLILNLKSFYHIDLYRLENETDMKGLGLEEILADKSNIVAIEWPEKIEKFLPKNKIHLNFNYLENNERKIEIE